MKAKTMLIIQTVGMYVMHLPLYAVLIIINLSMDVELQETLTKYLLIAALALMALMMPVCISNVIVSIVSVVKGNFDPTKPTMLAKLSLIPWYILNFVIGFVFVSIFLNPFMMIAIPIIIALLAASTYIIMLTTSFGDIAYFVYKAKTDCKVTPAGIVAVIFLFIFCLDVLGAIMMYKVSKKTNAQI